MVVIFNMTLREQTCCFTGHRNIKDEEIEDFLPFLIRIIKRLIHEGTTTFVTGGAIGFDTVCAEVILQLRERFPQIRLIVVAPYKDQSANWDTFHRHKYQIIKEMCDEYICLSDNYYKGCLLARNRYIVDISGQCIAFCKEKSSGSAYTVNYAEKKGVPVTNLGTQYIQLNLFSQ